MIFYLGGGGITFSYVIFINIWYTNGSYLKYNNIIYKLKLMYTNCLICYEHVPKHILNTIPSD